MGKISEACRKHAFEGGQEERDYPSFTVRTNDLTSLDLCSKSANFGGTGNSEESLQVLQVNLTLIL